MKDDKFSWWHFALSFALLAAAWQAAAVLLNKPVLPSPFQAAAAFWEGISGDMTRHFLISSYRVSASLLLALLLGVPLGLLLGRNKTADRLMSPIVYVVYPIPKIVFFPVIMILFGIGDFSKVFIITLIVFFQILVTTRDAVKGVAPASIYSVRSLGAAGWQVYRHVIIPVCLPELITATRISLGTAIAVLFLAETVAGSSGLGYYILSAMDRAAFSQMYAGIMAMGLLGLLLYLLLEGVEHWLCQWKQY